MLGENRCARFACHFPEARNDARGDGAWFSVTDQAPVSFDHGNDLGSRPGKETLIRDVNIVARNVRL